MSKAKDLYEVHTHGVNIPWNEIYLHSTYSDVSDDEGNAYEPGVDYKQATTFIKNLHVLDVEPFDPILVHLHSIGGNWDDGMAICDSIILARSPVTIVAYAQASSMSGVILQSADLRLMMPNCHFLMHYGSTSGGGHPMAVKSHTDFHEREITKMLMLFAERAYSTGQYFKAKKSATVKTAHTFFEKQLKKHVDWFLSAEEAVYYGLADSVLGGKEYPDLHSLREGSQDGE